MMSTIFWDLFYPSSSLSPKSILFVLKFGVFLEPPPPSVRMSYMEAPLVLELPLLDPRRQQQHLVARPPVPRRRALVHALPPSVGRRRFGFREKLPNSIFFFLSFFLWRPSVRRALDFSSASISALFTSPIVFLSEVIKLDLCGRISVACGLVRYVM